MEFRVVLPEKKEDGEPRLEILPGKITLAELFTNSNLKYDMSAPYIIDHIDLTCIINQVPFDLPYQFAIHNRGIVTETISEFVVKEYQTEYNIGTRRLMNQPFQNRDVMETYGCVMEEILKMDSVRNENYHLVDTSSAFYDIVYQHQRSFQKLLEENGVLFQVTEDDKSRDPKTKAVTHVRMSLDTHTHIMRYLKNTIFQHIKFAKMDSSYLEIRSDKIGFNRNLSTTFARALDAKIRHQEPTIQEVNTHYKTPSNVRVSTQSSLQCTLVFQCSLYALYPRDSAPSHASYMRFLEKDKAPRFPDPREATRRVPSVVSFSDEIIRFSSSIKEEERGRRIREAIDVKLEKQFVQPKSEDGGGGDGKKSMMEPPPPFRETKVVLDETKKLQEEITAAQYYDQSK
jgi:hypothetical protein